MVKIIEIANYLETLAPPALQESYDNAGLIVGDPEKRITSALLSIDVTEAVVDEALRKNAGLIVAHHPVIFSGLKKLTGRNYVERTVLKAVKNEIAIYAAHTNLDAAPNGVNETICRKLNLHNTRILQPVKGQLRKLVTFIPHEVADVVRKAVFDAGAGHIGNYDSCGYSLEGTGSFRGNEDATPYVGTKGQIHNEKEIRFETIFPSWIQKQVIAALEAVHPYEEVAFDIYPLDNYLENTGMGMIGELSQPMDENAFLSLLKNTFHAGCIKHTVLTGKMIRKVAVCGGAGSFLLQDAIAAKADIFVSGDFKYHQFFDAENKIIIADIGHYESEQFTKELFFELLIKKFPKFALHFSEVNTNPVYYF